MPTCDQVVDLAPAYVLGALDEAERGALERHVTACPGCSDRLAEEHSIVTALALAAPQRQPPARLQARLMAAVRAEAGPPRQPLWRRLFPAPLPTAVGAAATAGLAFAVSLGWGLGLQSRIQSTPPPVPAAIVSSPEYEWTIARAQMHRLTGSESAPEARGWIYVDPAVDQALLVAYKLPPLQPGLAYQLWLIQDGQRQSGGLFAVDEEGYGWLKVKSPKAIGAFDRVGVTVEPLQGSAGPTGARVLGGQL
jgi:anti-sigma-K factor RskA